MTNRNLAVNLFCGAGGTTLGLEKAGYTVVGYEKWGDAVESHRMNRMECRQVDLKEVDIPWPEGTIDLVWGSPPCQPFSKANGGKQGRLDPRDCVPDYLLKVRQIMPRITIMENVSGLVGAKNVEYLAWIVTNLEQAGYKVRYKVLNAAEYGVPQLRKRFILIARLDRTPRWPVAARPQRFAALRHHGRGAGLARRRQHRQPPRRVLVRPPQRPEQERRGRPDVAAVEARHDHRRSHARTRPWCQRQPLQRQEEEPQRRVQGHGWRDGCAAGLSRRLPLRGGQGLAGAADRERRAAALAAAVARANLARR
jgi:DNA-cytosine methyltransferase